MSLTGERWGRATARLPVVLVALGALAVRLAYVLAAAPRTLPFSDSYYYQLQANDLVHGRWFVNPFTLLLQGRAVPTAVHPPLYTLELAVGSVFGGTTVEDHQILGCVVGTLSVVAVGLVTRRLAGPRAGVCGALVAAIYPALWLNDGGIDAEGLYALLIAATLIAAYRFIDRPSFWRASLLGGAIGLAMLTRGDGVWLIVLLVLPLGWACRNLGLRRAAALTGVTIAASALVVSPWEIRNLATFERPVFLASDQGSVLAAANCNLTYHGKLIGLWSSACFPKQAASGDESVQADADTRKGLSYVRRHLTELPGVVVVRVARIWQLYKPMQDANFSTVDGRPRWTLSLWVDSFYVLVPFAVWGYVVLVRRRARLLPVNAQLLVVTVVAALSWGSLRFRTPADVALAVLGGVGLEAAIRYLWPAPAGRTGAEPAQGSVSPSPASGARVTNP